MSGELLLSISELLVSVSSCRYCYAGRAVPSELDALHALIAAARADHPGLDEAEMMMFETGLIEIADNIITHGQPAGSVRWWVTLIIEPSRLIANLIDDGAPVLLPHQVHMSDALADHGRGLALAQATLDMLSLARLDDRNHWLLERDKHTQIVACQHSPHQEDVL